MLSFRPRTWGSVCPALLGPRKPLTALSPASLLPVHPGWTAFCKEGILHGCSAQQGSAGWEVGERLSGDTFTSRVRTAQNSAPTEESALFCLKMRT